MDHAVIALAFVEVERSGVANGPSAVAVTKVASRAARIVALRLSLLSSRKAGGVYIGETPCVAKTDADNLAC
jgi:hypothetical protein